MEKNRQGSAIPGTHVKTIRFIVRETSQQRTGIRCPAVDADIIQSRRNAGPSTGNSHEKFILVPSDPQGHVIVLNVRGGFVGDS